MADYLLRHEPMKLFPFSFYPCSDHTLFARSGVKWLSEIDAWCEDQFGPRDYARWTRDIWTFRFTEENDAMAFKMRWCGSFG